MRTNISCSGHIFICFGTRSFRMTSNQRLQTDSLALSGHTATGFGQDLSHQFIVFIHQRHLSTTDSHRHRAMSEVPWEISILGDLPAPQRQRTFFFRNWWVPLPVHQFWTRYSWETEQWLSLSLSPATSPPRGQVAQPHCQGLYSASSNHVGHFEGSGRVLGTAGTNPPGFHIVI